MSLTLHTVKTPLQVRVLTLLLTERKEETREKPCSEHVPLSPLSLLSEVSTQRSRLYTCERSISSPSFALYTRTGDKSFALVANSPQWKRPIKRSRMFAQLPPTRFERSFGHWRLGPSSRAPHAHTLGRRFEGRAGNSFEADALITATPHSASAWSTCCQSSSLHRVSGKASTEAPGWTAAATAATSTRAAFGTGRRCR